MFVFVHFFQDLPCRHLYPKFCLDPVVASILRFDLVARKEIQYPRYLNISEELCKAKLHAPIVFHEDKRLLAPLHPDDADYLGKYKDPVRNSLLENRVQMCSFFAIVSIWICLLTSKATYFSAARDKEFESTRRINSNTDFNRRYT